MTWLTRNMDLARLNSMTRYPPIPTYHQMHPDQQGIWAGTLLDPSDALPVKFDGQTIVTEKLDGCNGRLLCMPDGRWLIGSRDELLTADSDLVPNPAQGIVAALRPIAERLAKIGYMDPSRMHVFYVEVYGQPATSAWRNYTGNQGPVGVRLFDVGDYSNDYMEQLERIPSQISSWREHGGQQWLPETALNDTHLATQIPLVPRLRYVDAGTLPTGIAETHTWLRDMAARTAASIDGATAGAAEGVVLRREDRSAIAKVRYQNHRRTEQVYARQGQPL